MGYNVLATYGLGLRQRIFGRPLVPSKEKVAKVAKLVRLARPARKLTPVVLPKFVTAPLLRKVALKKVAARVISVMPKIPTALSVRRVVPKKLAVRPVSIMPARPVISTAVPTVKPFTPTEPTVTVEPITVTAPTEPESKVAKAGLPTIAIVAMVGIGLSMLFGKKGRRS